MRKLLRVDIVVGGGLGPIGFKPKGISADYFLQQGLRGIEGLPASPLFPEARYFPVPDL